MIEKNNCVACGGNNLLVWANSVNEYTIFRCADCGCGQIISKDGQEVSYDDYGSYITEDNTLFVENKRKIGLKKIIFFKILSYLIGLKSKMLDFGAGAGFFVKSCLDYGFENTYMLEPSKRFRSAAELKTGVPISRIFKDLDNVKEIDFKMIFMFDVIEHFNTKKVHYELAHIASKMKSGGYIIGMTPNFSSLNIRLHKDRDPAVAPPSHAFLFTRKSLDFILKKNGFKKIMSITYGFSNNSFFRKKKFEPSWLEKPTKKSQKVNSFLIRCLFAAMSPILSILGLGYHIIYIYEKD